MPGSQKKKNAKKIAKEKITNKETLWRDDTNIACWLRKLRRGDEDGAPNPKLFRSLFSILQCPKSCYHDRSTP
jgi:hypothetical protein